MAEIDPAGNRDLMPELLKDDSYSIRSYAAKGLSKINDRAIMLELDVVASKEVSPRARHEMQGYADAIRSRLNGIPAAK